MVCCRNHPQESRPTEDHLESAYARKALQLQGLEGIVNHAAVDFTPGTLFEAQAPWTAVASRCVSTVVFGLWF